MNNIKDISQVTDGELNKMIETGVSVSFKYFGNQINVYSLNGNVVFRKSKGANVTITDLLVSDIYYKPISYIVGRNDRSKFVDGRFIYDYIHDCLITEKDDIETDNFLVRKKKELTNFDSSILKTRKTDKILEHLGFADTLVTIFVNDNNSKPYFKLSNITDFKTDGISDISQLIYNDVLMSIDLSKLKFIKFSIDPDEIYVNIVNSIFINYVNSTAKNVGNQNFDLPAILMSNLSEKKRLLAPEIKEFIGDSQPLYDLYTVCLIMLRNSHIKNNKYITHQGHRKQYEVNQFIKTSKANQFEFSVPTFSEFIGEKD